jgi:HTH-type transcriptional regulator, repressor for puuD
MTTDQPRDRLVLRLAGVQPVARGAGVRTYPLVGRWNADGDGVTSGISEFEPGVGLPLHTHNIDETVLILDGEALFDLDGTEHELTAGDATWIAAGVPHRFANRGAAQLRFHWAYSGRHVTRTICATGETVEHLSDADRFTS